MKWIQFFQCFCVFTDAVTATAKSLQSCPTLCNPIDSSPPGSPILGILQARVLEWVAISFSTACKWIVKLKSLSRVQLLATSWTAAYQAPPSMGFSRQEYWSGVPLPSPRVLEWNPKVLSHPSVLLAWAPRGYVKEGIIYFHVWVPSAFWGSWNI